MSTAALLVNLGSPDSTEVKDVKKYLDEFLMDPRVIDLNYLLRTFLVRGIILNTRPKKSAEAYKSIWQPEGSPLIIISKKLQKLVRENARVPVGLAMRYGNPSIVNEIGRLLKEHPEITKLFVVPLYPHYAMSSYETVVEKVKDVVKKHYPQLELEFQPPFYRDEDYIKILSESVKTHLEKAYDHVLFSYHGVPERHILKGDITGSHCLKTEGCCSTDSAAHQQCYRHQCYKTSELVAETLGIPKDKWSVSFQSRLGRDPWLQPYTDAELKRFGGQNTERLVVLCPAFVSDCLETLEEIVEEGVHTFKESGGKTMDVIPCLNDNSDWAGLLANWINEKA